MIPELHRMFVYRPILAWRGETATWRLMREKRALEGVDSASLHARQRARLAAMIEYALEKSPFYRARCSRRTGVRPEQVDQVLGELPILTKRDLQLEAGSLRVPDFRGRTWSKSTGGSTAEPVTVWKDPQGMAEERAATWVALGWTGIRPSDRVVRFWGVPLTVARRRSARMADLAMNRIRLSAFDLRDEDLARNYERCLRFRPAWFYGYATAMDYFAQFVEREKLDGRRLGVRTAVPTSEPLPDGGAERLARVFGSAVQIEYGCGEAGALAYGCERGLLHIMADNVHLEVLRPDGEPARAGEEGEVLVTDLTNHAMPLLRLRMGDTAVVGDACSCGRPGPTLARVWGRMHDEVYTPLGRRWHGEQLDYLLSTLRSQGAPIRQYQVVQVEEDLLDVRLVMEGELTERITSTLTEFIREQLDGMKANVRVVDAIERSPNGKLQVVRNDLLTAAPAAQTGARFRTSSPAPA